MTDYRLRYGFSYVMAIIVVAILWFIIIQYVEWDGDKPGGWGWLPAIFTMIVVLIFAGGITKSFLVYYLVTRPQNVENEMIEQEKRNQLRIERNIIEQARRDRKLRKQI